MTLMVSDEETRVRRYVDLVHAAAVRQMGGGQVEDVVQAVFLIMARRRGRGGCRRRNS